MLSLKIRDLFGIISSLGSKQDVTKLSPFGDERTNMAVYLTALLHKFNGPVVQNIVSLTSSLRGQLVKCFTTLY